MINKISKAILKAGVMLPSKLKHGAKEVAKEVAFNKVINTGSFILSDINNTVSKGITQEINQVKSLPKDIIQEFKKHSYHQAVNQPFGATFDYFKQYHQANATRYTPTPNLAEYYRLMENRDRSIREQFLRSRPTY